MGVTTVLKGPGKHAVEALSGWLPASDCARKTGVRSNHGLTLQSFRQSAMALPQMRAGEDEGLKAESSAGGAVWLRRLGVVSTLKRNKQTTERRSL